MNAGPNRQKVGIWIIDTCLILIAASLPFNILINSYCILLFCIVAFFASGLKKKWRHLLQNKSWCIWPIGYFVWMAIRLIWDKSPNQSMQTLETGFSFLVFPLMLGSMETLKSRSVKRVLVSFAVANLIGSVFCLWKSYLAYKESNYFAFLFYHHLSEHIGISAIYFAMYCVFSVYILFYYFLLNKVRWQVRLLSFLCIGFLSVFIMMLSSKTFMFILYLSALIVVVYSFYYLKYRLGAAVMFLLLIAIPILLIKFPYVSARVRDTQVKEYAGASDNQNGIAVRGVFWESSWNLIRDAPVAGWGHFGAIDALQNEYLKKGFADGVKQKYNSHNQYLFTWLCYGLVGLAVLSLFLGQLLKTFFRTNQFLGICLALMFILANITECMLETHKGIVFFLFFSSLIVFHLSGKTALKTEEQSF
jgi:O-antigen ligase